MELTKQPKPEGRWIVLSEPDDLAVLMRELTDAEMDSIHDAHGYIPYAPRAKGQAKKLSAVVRDVIKFRVLDWKGFTNGSGPLSCTDENKLLLNDKEVIDTDGEMKTLWTIAVERFNEAKRAELKNL